MKNYMTAQPAILSQEPLRRQSHVEDTTRNLESISLVILIGAYELQLTVPRKTKVHQLNQIIKAYDKLHEMHGPMGCQPCCLASCDGYEVMDYWLLQEQKTLEPIRNNERLKVLYTEPETEKGPISLSDFELLKCLGKGGSCAVYLVRNRRSCQLLALKQIAKEYISEYKRFEQILRQRKILLQLPVNKFTINCHAAFESDRHLNFIMDYCPGGELFYHIKDGLLADNASVKVYFCEILSCIEFLHNNRILYRDLKPENILVDGEGHLRIADFGLSKMGFKQDEVADSYCGSPEYMAPEMLLQSGYNYTLDLYTLGVILYEFTTGLPPFYSEDQQILFNNITNNEVEYPQDIHPSLRRLLERMLKKDPNERICSMEEIKQSEWFADVNWGIINQRCYKPAITLDLYKTYIHQEFLKEDVTDLNNQYLKFNLSEPLFEFFKFEKPSCKSILYDRLPKPHPSSIRQSTEISQKDSLRCNKKTIIGDKYLAQKPFMKTNKKNNSSVNITGLGSNKMSSNHINTLPDQPKQIKKKITLVKRNQKENQCSAPERNHSQTPKSNSLKKLTVISGKSFGSKRQSDYGQEQRGSASRDGSESKSKSKSIRQILSTKKITNIGNRESNPNIEKRTLKSTYRIMLG